MNKLLKTRKDILFAKFDAKTYWNVIYCWWNWDCFSLNWVNTKSCSLNTFVIKIVRRNFSTKTNRTFYQTYLPIVIIEMRFFANILFSIFGYFMAVYSISFEDYLRYAESRRMMITPKPATFSEYYQDSFFFLNL